MSYMTTCEKLRPFGIRQLGGHETLHGVVHISAPQYNSTVHSYPDAVLTYTDDDDGETITVGSGLELAQRLDEAITQSGPEPSQSFEAVRSPSRTTFGDEKIPLFDIKQTQDNLVIWREHEAYSSKSLREQYGWSRKPSPVQAWSLEGDEQRKDAAPHASLTSSPPPTHKSVSPPLSEVKEPSFDTSDLIISIAAFNEPASDEEVDRLFTKLMLKRGWDELPERAKQQMGSCTRAKKLALLQQENPTEVPRVPVATPSAALGDLPPPSLDGLEISLGIFADFLDSTAAVLRNTAQKTRDADTTPIENFLGGMKDIFTEVGQLGVEVLQTLETELTQTRHASTMSALQLPQRATAESPTTSTQRIPSLQKRVSFAKIPKPRDDDQLHDLERGVASVAASSTYSASRDTFKRPQNAFPILETSASAQTETKPAPASQRPARRRQSQGVVQSLYDPKLGPESTSYNGKEKAIDSHEQSIIDRDYANSDFLAKYPPLISLRRARTVGSLRQPSSTQDQLNTKRALTRYPSISQLESPSQGQKEGLASHMSWYSPAPWDPESQAPIYPTVWPKTETSQNVGSPTPNSAVDTHKVDANEKKMLPGAWPDKLEDSVTLPLARNVTSQTSYGSIGVMDARHRPARPVSPALSCRNTSPPKDTLFAPPGELRRVKTVTTAHPAARLNTPFDPGFDASRTESAGSARRLPARANTMRANNGTQPSCNQDSADWYSYQASKPASRPEPPSLWSQFQNEVILSPAKAENSSRKTFKAPQTRASQVVPGAWPYPTVPKPSSRPAVNHFGPRPMRSEPNFAYARPAFERHTRGGPLPMPMSKVDGCVKSLKQMGYGMSDPNEAARLHVYASATGGDVMDAVTMIEDDREAAEAIKLGPIRTL